MFFFRNKHMMIDLGTGAMKSHCHELAMICCGLPNVGFSPLMPCVWRISTNYLVSDAQDRALSLFKSFVRSLPVFLHFGLRKQQQGELGHEWQAGAPFGGVGKRGLVSMTTSTTETGFLRPEIARRPGVHRHCWDDLPRSPQGQRFGDVTQGWGNLVEPTFTTTERWINWFKIWRKKLWQIKNGNLRVWPSVSIVINYGSNFWAIWWQDIS